MVPLGDVTYWELRVQGVEKEVGKKGRDKQ